MNLIPFQRMQKRLAKVFTNIQIKLLPSGFQNCYKGFIKHYDPNSNAIPLILSKKAFNWVNLVGFANAIKDFYEFRKELMGHFSLPER